MNTENVLSFLADNYKYFMIASGVLLIALIGFIVDGKKKKKNVENVQQMPQGSYVPSVNTQAIPNAINNNEVVQNAVPSVEQNINQPVDIVTQNQGDIPSVDAMVNTAPIENAQTNDTIFTAPPVNSNMNTSEQLIIEEPQTSANNNGIDALITEAPSVPVQPEAQTVADAQSIVNTEPAEVVIEQPTMQAPQMEVPVSMEREEPVMQAPQMPQVPPQPEVVVSQPQQTYQNTIQQ